MVGTQRDSAIGAALFASVAVGVTVLAYLKRKAADDADAAAAALPPRISVRIRVSASAQHMLLYSRLRILMPIMLFFLVCRRRQHPQ